MKKKKLYKKQTIPYFLLFIVIMGIMLFYSLSRFTVNEFTYNEFIDELSKGTVEKIEVAEKKGAGLYFITGRLKEYPETETFKVNVPLSEQVLDNILVYTTEEEKEFISYAREHNFNYSSIMQK